MKKSKFNAKGFSELFGEEAILSMGFQKKVVGGGTDLDSTCVAPPIVITDTSCTCPLPPLPPLKL